MDTSFILQIGVSCLSFLIGIVAGVVLLVRKQKITGILVIIGFTLFALEPGMRFLISSFAIFEGFYDTVTWLYTCFSASGVFFGTIALVIALTRTKHVSQEVQNDSAEIIEESTGNVPLQPKKH